MKIKWWWILAVVIFLIILVNNFSKINIENKVEVLKITPTITLKKNNEKYQVKKVVDGDTLVVEQNSAEQTVRLIGIDAPEFNEDGAKEATIRLKELVEGKEVILESDESQSDKDVYGRILRYIYVDNILINQKMIEEGLSEEYTFKTAYKYQDNFKSAEISAKDKGLGVWGR